MKWVGKDLEGGGCGLCKWAQVMIIMQWVNFDILYLLGESLEHYHYTGSVRGIHLCDGQ